MYPLITIPTRGRTDKQTTVEYLPKEIHKHVVLVCPKEEKKTLKKNYPSVNVVAQPSSIKTIAAKREWIMKVMFKEQFPDYKYAWMFDDDLYFSVFLPELNLHRSVSNYPKESRRFWLKKFPVLCKKYKVSGIGTKAFALKGGIRDNYHLGFAFGMHRSVISKIKWNRIDLYVDIDYTLQFLRRGIRIGVTYDMTLQQKLAAAPGGLSGERTDERVEKALQKLLKFHPDFVKRKDPSASHAMSNTRISWAKAAKAGGL